MPNGRCRTHGGASLGAPKGNNKALKHGRYTAETIAVRSDIASLLRAMKLLAMAAGLASSPMEMSQLVAMIDAQESAALTERRQRMLEPHSN